MIRLSRRLALGVTLAVVGVDAALLWPGPAAASTPAAVGGWRIERQTTPAGAVPTSPLTDDGTLTVRNGPAGVLAFSALRYDGTSGLLRLELNGQPPAVVPAIDACRVTSTWVDGVDQTWDSRPTYDCSHHVAAIVSGTQLAWDLDAAFQSGGGLDVALVPDPADQTPYAVSFVLPTAASFQPNDTNDTLAPPPLTADAPGGPAISAPGPGSVPSAAGIEAPAAASPVVAPATPPTAPQFAASPTAATREPGSRTAGAAALAAFAFILLVRSFVTGGGRGHAPRSLLVLGREGS
jgi:hypothetical protein